MKWVDSFLFHGGVKVSLMMFNKGGQKWPEVHLKLLYIILQALTPIYAKRSLIRSSLTSLNRSFYSGIRFLSVDSVLALYSYHLLQFWNVGVMDLHAITKFRFSFSLLLKNISLMCPLPPNPSVKFLGKLIKEIQKTCLPPHPCLSKRRILLLVHQLGPPLVSPPAPPWRAMRTSNQGRAVCRRVRSKSRLSLPVKTRKQLWY